MFGFSWRRRREEHPVLDPVFDEVSEDVEYTVSELHKMTCIGVKMLRLYIHQNYLKATKVKGIWRIKHKDYLVFLGWARGERIIYKRSER